jgi:glycosyltransferase involved in cell wall biosynthesis
VRNQDTVAVVGASGYGNVGDDLYPAVLRRHLPGCPFVFLNSDPPRKLPKGCRLLVMGPGGVIYQDDTAHLAYMAEYMDQAMAKKIPIIFLSCGVQTENISGWSKYLEYADSVTVRSQKDAEYVLAAAPGAKVTWHPDLGYLFDRTEPVAGLPKKYTVFSPIAPAKHGNQLLKIYLETPPEERLLLRLGAPGEVRPTFDAWLAHGPATEIFGATPEQANYVIAGAQTVYTGRYHGMVLARRAGVTFQTGGARQLKIVNEDRGADFARASRHIETLVGALRRHGISYRPPRVAIVHEDFSLQGGGEVLVSTMAEALVARGFEATIYTFDIAEDTRRVVAPSLDIRTLRRPDVPSSDDSLKRYLFSELDVSGEHDFFIFSGHASQCAARRHKPNLLYAHNVPKSEPSFPKVHPREVLGETNPEGRLVRNADDVQVYLREAKEINPLERWWRRLYEWKSRRYRGQVLPDFVARKVDALRYLLNTGLKSRALKFLAYQSTNRQNLAQIERVLANSRNIQAKLKAKYGRDAEVCYPPIQTERFRYGRSGDFWLSVNRLVPLKRVEMQLEAFALLPDEKLVILGAAQDEEYRRYLFSRKPDNVEFRGVVTEEEKAELLATCRGFVFTAEDEDFGMAVVEAMAAGKPVIVPDEGGCRETVEDGVHGVRIPGIDAEKLRRAITEMSPHPERFREACRRQAERFSVDRFADQIVDAVREGLAAARRR